MDLAVDVERPFGGRVPAELGRPLEARGTQPLPSGPQALTSASAIDSGSCGSASRAQPPAVSGIALVSEVTTGQPAAMASRIGRPKVSLKDGYTKTSAAR